MKLAGWIDKYILNKFMAGFSLGFLLGILFIAILMRT